jgi:hypothetical protein
MCPNSVPPDFKPQRIIELYKQLGREVAAHGGTQGALAAVTHISAQAVPGADYASVTRGSAGGVFRTLAATDDAATRADQIQYEVGNGPCVDAAVKDGVFTSADLETDNRWPVFGPRAVDDTGIRSVLSIRMVLDEDDAVAALNIYALARDAFDTDSRTMGTLLALHGAVAVSRVIIQDKAAHLEKALETSREIGMAMGVLMSTYKLTDGEAFDALRIASQGAHRKVREVALDVIHTGMLELPQLPSAQH